MMTHARNLLLLALAVAGVPAVAQPPARDTLVSPEVRPDRTVTFRIRAPKAAQVTLFGAWMPVGSQQPMVRDADGVWSVTVGPLAPNGYLYSFTVDGVTIADPVNPDIKLRQRTSASLLEIPGNPPEPWEIRDVPHGAVEVSWLKSKVLDGSTRQVFVYLPPGYGKSTTRYPVLYLLHGSGDVPASWTQAGKANLILDNLIADRKAAPMIVVMPGGHAVPFGSARAVQAKNTELFEEYLVDEIVPWVEASYRTARGRENRAIAGLSMGGGQAFNVGFAHLDLFSAIGVFSASGGADLAGRFQQQLAHPAATNSKLKVFWIGIGKQDAGYERAKQFSAALQGAHIEHPFVETEGGHVWAVWRWALSEYAPLLFRR
ncbi:MAG: esterase [Acidobacteria bacterium]|nr:esterase [Acidobacteriota bacterium]